MHLADNPGLADELLSFLTEAQTPYHVVRYVENQLHQHGVRNLKTANVDHQQGGSDAFYYVKDHTCIVAVKIGRNFWSQSEKAACIVMASHCDSPCIRTKPTSRMQKENCEMVDVSTYGGGLWHAWFDRGLGVAGLVTTRQDEHRVQHELIKFEDPIAYIPNLCIHLQNAEERSKFNPNRETQLRPILGLAATPSAPDTQTNASPFPPSLLSEIASRLMKSPEDILSYDLCFFDAVPARRVGIHKEFVDAQGLDNKSSVYCNLKSFLIADPDCVNDGASCFVYVTFDHEEIGSATTAGADSEIMPELLRILTPNSQALHQLSKRTLIVSCDAAHAVHPNYPEKHQENHKCAMGKGTVIKEHVSKNYATSSRNTGFVLNLANTYKVPVQLFTVRNDAPCGRTIGSLLARRVGIDTIDVGLPLLAMHSIRELCHIDDSWSPLFCTLIHEEFMAHERSASIYVQFRL